MNPPYGVEDASYQAAGEQNGIRKLTERFYEVMADLPAAQKIFKMHPKDIEISRDKLTLFLCGWLGGPKLFREKYGSIALPGAHGHLPVGEAERDAWLECMRLAVQGQPYKDDFKIYLLEQLAVPAERIRQFCAMKIT